MTTYTIKKGFDIRLTGAAQPRMDQAPEPATVRVSALEFPGLKPKPVVAEGDAVRTGDRLFFDKSDSDTALLSPATGKVTKVELGARRALQWIEIAVDSADRFAEVPTVTVDQLSSLGRDELIRRLKGSGLWPLLRQRPIGRLCDASKTPSAIYVNGMDTEPLAADPAVACLGRGAELQAGIDVLRALTDGKVYLTVAAGRTPPDEFRNLRGVEVRGFAGPHPAGLVGTHISRIAPLGEGEVAWFLKVQEAALIGAWVRDGRYPAVRTVAVAGSRAPTQQYYRVRQGAALSVLTGGNPVTGDVRVINGTVLNGVKVAPDGYLGFYANTVTLIPEGGDTRDMFGWGLPGFGKLSASRSVFSWLTPKPAYDLDARLNGGVRPIVNIGSWDRVMPLDIYPTYLVRAIQAGDVEEALKLGLLEVTEEDVALCTFVDHCKIEVGDIIRKGLDMYEKEA
ncbi:MAG: Na(+)-translocating NADH-quinone reductase subunit A [Planctomycetes bacterium]|nr:Na(+)-translocating NADH-quinone reductase subunit A [Planctomycetota bacterium]MCB9889173.1 Na(+)-translocating NADH-quinone reductase subunit A [Planctomycetota bacterium]